jgi:hypothetical protein
VLAPFAAGAQSRSTASISAAAARFRRQRAAAFMGLLKGANFGKQLMRVGPDRA